MGKTYNLELTQEEVELIHEVFHGLTFHHLHEWTDLLPTSDEKINEETSKRWETMRRYDKIRIKLKSLLEDNP